MKKNVCMSSTTLLLCALVFIGCETTPSPPAKQATDGTLSFTLTSNGTAYTVSRIKSGVDANALTEITIPTEINGIPVTKIGNAFPNGNNVEKLHISKNIVSIDVLAFQNLDKLKTITVDAQNTVYAVENDCLVKDNGTYYICKF